MLTVEQAAAELGLTRRALYTRLRRGTIDLPRYRFGRTVRLSADDVRAFRERSRVEAPGSAGPLPGLASPEYAPGAHALATAAVGPEDEALVLVRGSDGREASSPPRARPGREGGPAKEGAALQAIAGRPGRASYSEGRG